MGSIKLNEFNEELKNESGVAETSPMNDLELNTTEVAELSVVSIADKQDEILLEYEDKSRREEFVKHFRTNKGTYQARYYGTPVHYWNEEEKAFREIDNEFTEHSALNPDDSFDLDGYENKYGAVKVRMVRNLRNGKIASLVKGEFALSFSLMGRKRKNRDEYEQSKGEASVFCHKRIKSKQRTLGNEGLHEGPNGGEVRYNEFVKGADLQFILDGGKLKENIIVKNKAESYEYGFTLKTKNLRAELSSDNKSVLFFPKSKIAEGSASENTNPVFTLPAAFMTDAKGAFSDDVEFELVKKNTGNFTLKVKPNVSWIENEDRVFPINIDPTIVHTKKSGLSSRTWFDIGSDPRAHTDVSLVGRGNYNNTSITGRTHIFVDQPLRDSTKKVISAKYCTMTYSSFSDVPNSFNGSPGNIEIRKITNKPASAMTLPQTSTMFDYIVTTDLKEHTVVVVDLTKVYSDDDFRGFELRLDSQNNNKGIPFYDVTVAGEGNFQASLLVDYIDNAVITSDKQQKNSVNRAGTGILDLYTQNLQFIHDDFKLGGERLPIEISHIYNEKNAGWNELRTNCGNSAHLGIGKGWKTNFHQFLFPQYASSNSLGVPQPEYLFVDHLGNQRILTKTTIKQYRRSTRYERGDESGKYTYEDNGGQIILKDKDANNLFFDYVYSYDYYRLSKIQDASGNTINITFENGDANAAKIKRVSNSVGQIVDFSYDTNGFLTSLNCASTGFSNQTIKYSYTDQKLIKISYPAEGDGYGYNSVVQSEYSYDGFGRLTSARDQTGYKLWYERNTNYKWTIKESTNISKISNTSVSGCTEKYRNTIEIEYAGNKTFVKTTDGKMVVHRFNATGMAVCSYIDNASNINSTLVPAITEGISYSFMGANETFMASLNGAEKIFSASDISITGSLTQSQWVSRAIYPTGALSGPFVVTCFAKAQSLPIDKHKKFRLHAQIYYTDGTADQEISRDFDFVETDWQPCLIGLQKSISYINKTVSYINVRAEYSHNNGTAQFKNIRLVNSRFAQQKTKRICHVKHSSFASPKPISDIVAVEYMHLGMFDIFMEQTMPANGALTEQDVTGMSYQEVPSDKYGAVYLQGGYYSKAFVGNAWGTDHSIRYVFRDGSRVDAFECSFLTTQEIDVGDGTVEGATLFTDFDGRIVKSRLINHKSGKTFDTDYTFNEKGKVSKEIDYRGVSKDKTYHTYGAITQSKTYYSTSASSEKFYEDYEYSDNGNTLTKKFDLRGTANNFTTEMVFDNTFGCLKSVKIPYNGSDKQTINYNYYSNGALRSMQNSGTSENISYRYTRGLLTELTSGNSTYTFEYDGFGMLTKTKLNDETYHETVYDYSGTNGKTITDASNGYQIKTYYDAKDRIQGSMEQTESGFKDLYTNTYDDKGRLKTVADCALGTGKTVTFNYQYKDTSDGSLDYVEFSGGRKGKIQATKDTSGRLTMKSIEMGTAQLGTVQRHYYYGYDSTSGATKPDNRLTSISTDNGASVYYSYDSLGRLSQRNVSSTMEYYRYLKQGTDRSTNYASSIQYGWYQPGNYGYDEWKDVTEDYTYNDRGYVSGINDGKGILYDYDKLGRLKREDNQRLGFTKAYTYDANGNIKDVKEYAYTTTSNLSGLSPRKTYNYAYATSGDKNRLISFDGSNIGTYDSIGNPCNYKGNVLKWERARKLKAYGGTTFAYDFRGYRQEKKLASGITHTYYTEGSKIHKEHRSGGKYNVPGTYGGMRETAMDLWYYYDAAGITGIEVNGDKYWFQRNVFGDVKRIFDNNGRFLAEYVYDAWGNHKVYSTSGSELTFSANPGHIAFVNPFRYRGYYFDQDLNLYYLNSRYYDPATGRFINADDINAVPDYASKFDGQNLYAYCLNNPIAYTDPEGYGVLLAIFFFVLAAVGLVLATDSLIRSIRMAYNDPTAENIILAVIAGINFGLALFGFIMATINLVNSIRTAVATYSLSKAAESASKGVANTADDVVRDGVKIQKVQQSDLTPEAWQRSQSLPHTAEGNTISSIQDGQAIHNGFGVGAGKGTPVANGSLTGNTGYLDKTIGNTIYELKPNNPWSIARGIRQLNQYNTALGGGYEMILVLY